MSEKSDLISCHIRDLSCGSKSIIIKLSPAVSCGHFINEIADRFSWNKNDFSLYYSRNKNQINYDMSETDEGQDICLNSMVQEPLKDVLPSLSTHSFYVTYNIKDEISDSYKNDNCQINVSKSKSDTAALIDKSLANSLNHKNSLLALTATSSSTYQLNKNNASSNENNCNFLNSSSSLCGMSGVNNFQETSDTGMVGLVNQAMTCYLNSLLQSLFMTPEFRNALYKWQFTGNEKEGLKSIPFQLQRLFLQLQTSKKKSVATVNITQSFGWDNNESWQQHDVQELCRVMFDALEMTWNGTEQSDLINQLYQGKMKDSIQCSQCGWESSRIVAYQDIPLVIRPFGSETSYSSLEESLRGFCTSELMDGNNQWFCEKCQKKVDAKKCLKFSTFPYILTMHFMRFDFDYSTMKRIKLNDRVTFPELLKLNEFIEEGNKTINTPMSSASSSNGIVGDYGASALLKNDNDLEYELFSIMIHSGNATGGHYYAYVKNFEMDEWFNFNDQTVTRLVKDDIYKTFGGDSQISFYSPSYSSSTNAYMLMYRKVDVNKNAKFMNLENFPDHLVEELERMKLQEEMHKRQQEIDRTTIKVKLFVRHPVEKKIIETYLMVHMDKTIEQATDIAWELLNLELIVPRDCVRLVQYDKDKDFIERSFESYYDLQRTTLFQILGGFRCFYDLDLLLDIKKTTEEFIPYDSGSINTEVSLVNLESQTVTEGFSLRITLHYTIKEMNSLIEQRISLLCGVSLENLESNLRLAFEYRGQIKLLDKNSDKQLKHEGFAKVNKVFVEFSGAEKATDFEKSQMNELIETHNNTIQITIKYTSVSNTKKTQLDPPISNNEPISSAVFNNYSNNKPKLDSTYTNETCQMPSTINKIDCVQNISDSNFKVQSLFNNNTSNVTSSVSQKINSSALLINTVESNLSQNCCVIETNINTSELSLKLSSHIYTSPLMTQLSELSYSEGFSKFDGLKKQLSPNNNNFQNSRSEVSSIMNNVKVNGVDKFTMDNKVESNNHDMMTISRDMGGSVKAIIEEEYNNLKLNGDICNSSSDDTSLLNINGTIQHMASAFETNSCDLLNGDVQIDNGDVQKSDMNNILTSNTLEIDNEKVNTKKINGCSSINNTNGTKKNNNKRNGNITSSTFVNVKYNKYVKTFKVKSVNSEENSVLSSLSTTSSLTMSNAQSLIVSFDKRISLKVFKDCLQQYVQMHSQEFEIYRVYENKNIEDALMQQHDQFSITDNNSNFMVKIGRSLGKGEFCLKIHQFSLDQAEHIKHLFDIVLKKGITVLEVKKVISLKLAKEMSMASDVVEISKIRLRKKSWKNPTIVYEDGQKFDDADIIIKYNSDVLMQLLDVPDTCDINKKCIFLRRWRPSTYSLDMVEEIIVGRGENEIIQKIAKVSGIEETRVQLSKVTGTFPHDTSVFDIHNGLIWIPSEKHSSKNKTSKSQDNHINSCSSTSNNSTSKDRFMGVTIDSSDLKINNSDQMDQRFSFSEEEINSDKTVHKSNFDMDNFENPSLMSSNINYSESTNKTNHCIELSNLIEKIDNKFIELLNKDVCDDISMNKDNFENSIQDNNLNGISSRVCTNTHSFKNSVSNNSIKISQNISSIVIPNKKHKNGVEQNFKESENYNSNHLLNLNSDIENYSNSNLVSNNEMVSGSSSTVSSISKVMDMWPCFKNSNELCSNNATAIDSNSLAKNKEDNELEDLFIGELYMEPNDLSLQGHSYKINRNVINNITLDSLEICTDGFMVYYRDCEEPLKNLTGEERKLIQHKENNKFFSSLRQGKEKALKIYTDTNPKTFKSTPDTEYEL